MELNEAKIKRNKNRIKTSKEERLTSNKFVLKNNFLMLRKNKMKRKETTTFIIEYFSHFNSRQGLSVTRRKRFFFNKSPRVPITRICSVEIPGIISFIPCTENIILFSTIFPMRRRTLFG